MKFLVALSLVLALAGGALGQSTSPIVGVGRVPFEKGTDTEFVCTGTFIRPNLVITAAHCVAASSPLSKNITAERGYRSIEAPAWLKYGIGPGATVMKGRVVWTSYIYEEVCGLSCDVAFIEFDTNWPATAQFGPAPPVGTFFEHQSMTLGFQYWKAGLRFHGTFYNEDTGWSVVVRGDAYPGASGSLLFHEGRAFGMVNWWFPDAQPTMLWGMTAERLQEALTDLDTRGRMVWCGPQTYDENGKPKERQVCRKK